jgi:hypothetical protein
MSLERWVPGPPSDALASAPHLSCVRTKLARGLLPREKPDAEWSGRGTRHLCVVCDHPIEYHHFEIEAEFRDRPSLHFHRDCFMVWNAEQQRATVREVA